MNADCKLIWESYSCKLITEVTTSRANVQRLIAKYRIDEPAARALIDRFNKVEGALKNKDIFAYGKLDELETAIGAVTTEREKVTKGAINVFENDEVTVLLIRTKEASIKNGRGTHWCISYDDDKKGDDGDGDDDGEDDGEDEDGDGNQFYQYFFSEDEPSIYFVISKTNDEKFAILKNKDGRYNYEEIRDKNNDQTKLQYILSKYNLQESIFKYAPITIQERLRGVISNLRFAYEYARDVIKGRWPEVEPYIMKDTTLSLRYARDIIGGRWPEAEPYIIYDRWAAAWYAIGVIKGRWPEAEPYIMENPGSALVYVRDVIKGRWPKAEPYIMEDPSAAAAYAKDVIKGRWREAEPHIMKDPLAAPWYAKNVIKGRWLEAEPHIMKDPWAAAQYAAAKLV